MTARVTIGDDIEIRAPRGAGLDDLLDAATEAYESARKLRAVGRVLETGERRKKGSARSLVEHADLMGRLAFWRRIEGMALSAIAKEMDVDEKQVRRWLSRSRRFGALLPGERYASDADYDESDSTPPEGSHSGAHPSKD